MSFPALQHTGLLAAPTAPVISQADASAQPPAGNAGDAGLTPGTYPPSVIRDG
jgi:hypothetical protein